MAHKLIGEHGSVIVDFYDVDGNGRDLCKHHPPERVRSLEVEVLDNKVGSLIVSLRTNMLASESGSCVVSTKRAVYLEKAHVDCAAFGVVIHRVLVGEARRLCG
jgi:hypothetical protein